MNEPEVALAFTADPWVEDLHRHLSDHGGARVRTLVVERESALDESYDVLVAGHRWPPLTRSLVDDVHARGRAIVGVFDQDERASREHLVGLGVDALVESDASPETMVRAISNVVGRRDHRNAEPAPTTRRRRSRIVAVGGPAGVGRTELAIELALAVGRQADVVLVDADDVGPAVAARLRLPIEPNLRNAIDAVEHGRGALHDCVVVEPAARLPVVAGLPNAAAWSHVRPGEVVRVLETLSDDDRCVVVDGAGPIEDVATAAGRGRFATARAVVAAADVVVSVCDASPHGVARFLAWAVECTSLAPDASLLVAVNRAPAGAFRRGELRDEIAATLPVAAVYPVPFDRRVAAAAWNGTPVRSGAFTRAVGALAQRVAAIADRRARPVRSEIEGSMVP